MEHWDKWGRDREEDKRRVYEFIVEYRKKHGGNSPSYRKIATGAGLSSVSMAYYRVNDLVDAGKLVRIHGELCLANEVAA